MVINKDLRIKEQQALQRLREAGERERVAREAANKASRENKLAKERELKQIRIQSRQAKVNFERAKAIRKQAEGRLTKSDKQRIKAKEKAVSKPKQIRIVQTVPTRVLSNKVTDTKKKIAGKLITPLKVVKTAKGEGKEKAEDVGKGLVGVTRGVGKGLFEIVTIPAKALKTSFNYGRTLRKRAEAGESYPLNNDVKKLALGTVKVSSYVKNNPGKSASIVAAGAAGVGKDIKKAFQKDPAEATGKAIAYLFPGTIVKGGVKAVGLGTKGVKSTAQAANLVRANSKVKVALARGGLTTSQTKSLAGAVGRASKVASAKKQDKLLRTALNKILKQRGLTVKKGLSIKNLSRQVAASKDKVKVITKAKKVVERNKKLKAIKVEKLKKAKVTVGPKAKIQVTKKAPKKKTITRVKIEGTKLKKVSKKEFEALKPKKKPGRPAKPEVKTKKTKVKTIDVTKLEKERFAKELAQKGIIEKGKTTFIDLNAVNRISKAKKVPTKVAISNKKAQAQFQIQIQKQTRLYKNKSVNLARSRKVNIVDLLKVKSQVKALKALIKRTKPLRLIATTALIAEIKGIERDISVAEARAQVPTFKKIPGQVLKPTRTPISKPITKSASISKTKSGSKGKSVTKTVTKLTGKAVKKKPAKKPAPIKLPPQLSFDSKLPKGSRLKFDIKFRERRNFNKPASKSNPIVTKTRKLGLPLNKAIKKGFGGIDKTTQASAQLVIAGTTTAKDITATSVKSLKAKFNVKKGKTALRFVEKNKARIDTRGEKKGLSLGKVIKKKRK